MKLVNYMLNCILVVFNVLKLSIIGNGVNFDICVLKMSYLDLGIKLICNG